MGWMDDYPKVQNMFDQVADEAAQDGAEGLSEFVKKAIRDLSEIANYKYDQWMNRQKKQIMDPQPTLEELQQMADSYNETMDLGRDAGVISVQFAMQKLGYTKEQIDEVVKLARPSLYEQELEQAKEQKQKQLELDKKEDQTIAPDGEPS